MPSAPDLPSVGSSHAATWDIGAVVIMLASSWWVALLSVPMGRQWLAWVLPLGVSAADARVSAARAVEDGDRWG